MRLVFAGTPEVALPALDALLASDRHEVAAVVTRADARAGRGRTMRPSPVKQRAVDAGIEVLTPARPSEPDFLTRLAELEPDCCPVVAYGALVPRAALDIPPLGWINLHFSVLPAWRGAAPVQRALMAGDDVTGASTFRLEEGLDTGPVFGAMTMTIQPQDTAGDLLGRLSADGAGLLLATLDGIEDGTVVAVPQPGDGVSLAPKVTTADARVDWTTPRVVIDRQIRGCSPAPGAWTTFRGKRLGLGPVVLPVDPPTELAAGEIADDPAHGVLIGSGSGVITLQTVRPEGRGAMPASDWARGARITAGERLE